MAAPTMDLKRLRTFQLAAKYGSLGRVASILRLTVPAVSIQIQRLEQDLGIELFERAGRRLSLTPPGATMADEVEKIFAAVDGALDTVARCGAKRERLSLAIANDLVRFFADPIAAFIKARPDIDVALRVFKSPEILAAVVAGEVEVGVGYFHKVPRTVEKSVLFKSGFSLVVPGGHRMARSRRPSFRQILEHRLIMLRRGTEMRRRIDQAISSAGLELKNFIEVGSCQSAREFAAKGLGAAIVHTTCLGRHRPDKLRAFDLSAELGAIDIAAIYKKARLSPVHAGLLTTLSGTM
jgi:DNA-binding transcriptional LysR family regulator